MTPSDSASAAPLPPLPDLGSAPPQDPGMGGMAGMMSGMVQIKGSVDAIRAECAKIIQSGAVPGAEEACKQITALAVSLLPMAAQSMMGPQPSGMGGGIGPVGM